jgi:hypothetical protein
MTVGASKPDDPPTPGAGATVSASVGRCFSAGTAIRLSLHRRGRRRVLHPCRHHGQLPSDALAGTSTGRAWGNSGEQKEHVRSIVPDPGDESSGPRSSTARFTSLAHAAEVVARVCSARASACPVFTNLRPPQSAALRTDCHRFVPLSGRELGSGPATDLPDSIELSYPWTALPLQKRQHDFPTTTAGSSGQDARCSRPARC